MLPPNQAAAGAAAAAAIPKPKRPSPRAINVNGQWLLHGTFIIPAQVDVNAQYNNLLTPQGRLNKCNHTTPSQYGGYGTEIMVPKAGNEQAMQILFTGAIAAMAFKFGADSTPWAPQAIFPFHDGDTLVEEEPAYAGCWVFYAKNKDAPLSCKDEVGNALIDATRIYSGCYGRHVVNFFAYTSGSDIGITIYSAALQFLQDGEKLGNNADAGELFRNNPVVTTVPAVQVQQPVAPNPVPGAPGAVVPAPVVTPPAPPVVVPPPVAADPLVPLQAGVDLVAYRTAGWTDEQLVAQGIATYAGPAAPAPNTALLA